MRQLVIILMLVVCALRTMAQQDSLHVKQNRFFVSVSGGLAKPTGVFADEMLSPYQTLNGLRNNYAGAVKTGYSSKIEVAFMLSKYFGISARYINTSNQTQALNDANLLYTNFTTGNAVVTPTNVVYATSGNWVSNVFSLGLVGQIKIKRVALRAHSALCMLYVRTPKAFIFTNAEAHLYTANTPQPVTFSVYQPMYYYNTYGFILGGDVRVRLVKKIGAIFSFDYLASYNGVDGYLYPTVSSGQTVPEKTVMDIYYSQYYFTLGVYYEF